MYDGKILPSIFLANSEGCRCLIGLSIRFYCVTVYCNTRNLSIVVSGNHFVKNLFPGLDQMPSPFAVSTICFMGFSQAQLLT